jgi:hypothetical protein
MHTSENNSWIDTDYGYTKSMAQYAGEDDVRVGISEVIGDVWGICPAFQERTRAGTHEATRKKRRHFRRHRHHIPDAS